MVISTTVFHSITHKLLGDAEVTFDTSELFTIRSLTHFCPNCTKTLCSHWLVSRNETTKDYKINVTKTTLLFLLHCIIQMSTSIKTHVYVILRSVDISSIFLKIFIDSFYKNQTTRKVSLNSLLTLLEWHTTIMAFSMLTCEALRHSGSCNPSAVKHTCLWLSVNWKIEIL